MNFKTDVIGTKIQHHQSLSSKSISKTIERLSTGLRINSASDDAAGLNISTRLKAFSNANQKGIENLKDGINLFSTMDSGLSSIEDMIQRIRELVVQSKNGTISNSDRFSIQQEINEITSGIEKIAKSTTYNDMKVINNSLIKLDGINDYVLFDNSLENITNDDHSIEVTFTPNTIPTTPSVIFGIQGWHHGIQIFPDKSLLFETWFSDGSGVNQSVYVQTPIDYVKEDETYQVIGTIDNTNRKLHLYVNGQEIGTGVDFPVGKQLYDYSNPSDGSLRIGIGNNPGSSYDYPFEGTIKEARIYNKTLSLDEAKDNFNKDTIKNGLIGEWISDDFSNTTIYNNIGGVNGTLMNGASIINDNITIRTGSTKEDVFDSDLTNVSSNALSLNNLNIDDPNALNIVDKALDKILGEHSRIGSTINTMSYRLDQLHISKQTNSNSLSSISDADFSIENSKLVKEQIKMQTSIAMLQKNNSNRESNISLLES